MLKTHPRFKHGFYGTREHKSWSSMKSRCSNPKDKSYPWYGGRGITVCDRWLHSFQNFIDDMWPRPEGHSLERIKNELGYSPENCKWATRVEQMNNTSQMRTITMNGKSQSLSAWARDLKTSATTIRSRLDKLGWSIERSLTTEPNYHH